jgi:hypothetical protein
MPFAHAQVSNLWNFANIASVVLEYDPGRTSGDGAGRAEVNSVVFGGQEFHGGGT